MVLNLPELNLDLSPPAVPDLLTRFQVITDSDFDKLKLPKQLNVFIDGLEDELTKIRAFQRELPLSFLLLNHAIGKLKEKASKYGTGRQGGELADETSVGANLGNDDQFDNKKNWMSTAQLWNPVISEDEDDRNRKSDPGECKLGKYREERGSFLSFNEDSTFSAREEESIPRLSLVTPGINNTPTAVDRSSGRGGIGGASVSPKEAAAKPQNKPPPPHETSRKQRRCWSPALHRRFVDALEKLGGTQVATPKQIRELMQVDGLTNDEVKSHLQKYRLHVRKLPVTKASTPSSNVATAICGQQLELGCLHSGSPEGPLHMGRSEKCNSASMEDSEDKDEESDGHSWKGSAHHM